jgi:hypothetical protein
MLRKFALYSSRKNALLMASLSPVSLTAVTTVKGASNHEYSGFPTGPRTETLEN